MGIIKCACCKKMLTEYKHGFCQICYRNFVQKEYIIVNNNFKKEWEKQIADDLIKNSSLSSVELAKKYNLNVNSVRYSIKKHLALTYRNKI